jgi:hypothetical protein
MKTYKNVEYAIAVQLLLFLLSIIVVFIVTVIALLSMTNLNSLLIYLLGIMISFIYYVSIKSKIIKTSDFIVTSENLEWNGKNIKFDQIESYKTYFLEGTARIKINLYDTSKIHLTSSKGYCNSDSFISLCKHLEKRFKGSKIEKKKTFFESNFGYYTVIVLTIAYMIIPIHSLLTGKDFKFVSFMAGLGALGTLWAGIKINRTK